MGKHKSCECRNRVEGCRNCYQCPLNNELNDYRQKYQMYIVSFSVGNIEYLRKISEPPMTYSAIGLSKEVPESCERCGCKTDVVLFRAYDMQARRICKKCAEDLRLEVKECE